MLLINFSLSSVLLLHKYKIIKYLKKQFHCLYPSMTLTHSNAVITRHENIHTKITPPHYKTTLGNAHDCKNKIIKEQVWSSLWRGVGQFRAGHLYIQAIKDLRIKTTA